jgi:hypothetical protein
MDMHGDDEAWLKLETRKSRRRVFWIRNRDLVIALGTLVAIIVVALSAAVVVWKWKIGGL